MLRSTALLIVASVFALSALETPLVIQSPLASNLTVVINPAVGTMTLYRILDGKLDQRGTANFISDLSLYEKWFYSEVDGQGISYLQTGSLNNKPTAGELIEKNLSQIKSSSAERAIGVNPLVVRARAAEKEFWSKEHPYDGVVSAALSTQYLMLVVPCKHTLMVYDTANEQLTLVAWHNYGPELYVPQSLNSTPTASELMNRLPKDIQEQQTQQLQGQLEQLISQSEQGIALKPSEVWIAAGKQERFVVFDSANHHVMSYEYTSRDLRLLSVRNTEIEMLIPSQLDSFPTAQEAYNRFTGDKSRKAYLHENGIDDFVAFNVYVESKQKSSVVQGAGKLSPLQANVNQVSGEITLDFTDRRKLVVYRFAGGEDQLTLKSLRDYTVDAGIAMLEAEIRDRNAARQMYTGLKKLKNPKFQLLQLQSTLKLNPFLHRELERDTTLVKALDKMEGYPAIIEEAAKKATALEQQRDELKKAIETKRKELADAKGKR